MRLSGRHNSVGESNTLVSTEKALDYLRKNFMPVQIFLNNNTAPAFTTPRNVDSKIAWLVLLAVRSHSTKVNIAEILDSCVHWSSKKIYSVIHQHLIHVIIVKSEKSVATGTIFDMRLDRCLTPSYLMVFEWFPPDNMLPESIWIYDVCFSRKICRKAFMPSYFDVLVQGGVGAIEEHVARIGQDFQGDKLVIRPYCGHKQRWAVWNRFLALHLRHVKTSKLQAVYLGTVLVTLGTKLNFTFDTVRGKDGQKSCNLGYVHMAHGIFCSHKDCNSFGLSFNMFMYMNTLMSSTLTPPSPYKLPSLFMPVRMLASFIIVGLTLSSGLLFLSSSKRMDAVTSVFLASSPFLSQVPSVKGQARSLRRFYIPWLLFTTFTTIVYTTMLEVYAVAPETRFSELSFDGMVRRRFKFLSNKARLIQEGGRLAKKAATEMRKASSSGTNGKQQLRFLQKEKILGEKIKEAGFNKSDPNLGFHLLKLNRKGRKVFVGMGSQTALYASVIKAFGLSAVLGKEQFFNLPYFWRFQTEKSSALTKTLEWMKATGLVHHFLSKAELVYVNGVTRRAVLASTNAESKHMENTTPDGVATEAIFLFVYGVLLSALGLTVQGTIVVLTKRLTRS